jgi:hypothetical protein
MKNVRLSLMIGPLVPLPAPREVIEALESLTVEIGSGETQGGFELVFGLAPRSPLHTLFLVSSGAAVPAVRVVISASVGGIGDVLMDGVMTHHEVQPGTGGRSRLTVKGKDLTALMDIVELDGIPYPAMPPAVRVLTVLARYAAFGVIPIVIPSIVEDVPIPIERIPSQSGTDYEYVTQLARDVGYVFYMDPGPAPGTSRAYWGPEIRVGQPQPALNVDMDAHTNVESLSFSFDKERSAMPIVYIHNRETRAPIPIPIPDVNPLSPPLGLIPPLPPRIVKLKDTARLSPAQAVMQGLAYAGKHADAVVGEGSLDVLRYGRILKSRQLVGVRGAGDAFDGLYYVSRVTHAIKRGEYKQRFSLARNRLVSSVSRVPA